MEAYLLSLGFRRTAEKAAKLASEHDLITKEDLCEAIATYAEGLVNASELHSQLTTALGLLSVDAAKLAIDYFASIRPFEALRLPQANHHRCSGCDSGEEVITNNPEVITNNA